MTILDPLLKGDPVFLSTAVGLVLTIGTLAFLRQQRLRKKLRREVAPLTQEVRRTLPLPATRGPLTARQAFRIALQQVVPFDHGARLTRVSSGHPRSRASAAG